MELQPGTTFSVVVQTDTNAVECELEMSIENGGQVIWSCDVSKGNEKTFYQYHNKFYACELVWNCVSYTERSGDLLTGSWENYNNLQKVSGFSVWC